MNWIIDIIIILFIAYSAYRGYHNGLIVELCGVLGIIIGAYVAYRFCGQLAQHIDLPREVAQILAFVAILVVIIILVVIFGRLCSKLLSFSGLGVINGLFGMVASVFKTVVVFSLLALSFVSINNKTQWVEQSAINQSKAITKLLDVSHMLFPYIDFVEVYYEKFVESLEKKME